MPASMSFRPAAVEAIHVAVRFRRPLLDPSGEYTHRRAWLLRIVSDHAEGFGEAVLHPAAGDAASGGLATLMRGLVPRLASGEVPDEAELLAEGEPGRAALAAVSGALSGLMALDGGERSGAAASAESVPVAATIGFGGPEAGAEAAAQAVELGFGSLELRAGFERQTDQLVERLRAIRAAVGPGPRLRVDAAGAWNLETAEERIAAIAPFRVEYVEQPLPAWDLAGHAALRERLKVPIALDESVDSEGSARAALAERAADVLIVKPARVGGAAVTARIAAAGAAAGAETVLGTYFETGIGIAAALRIAAALSNGAARGSSRDRAHGLATAGTLASDLLRSPLPIERGRMPVPGTIALDEEEVDRRALERVASEG